MERLSHEHRLAKFLEAKTVSEPIMNSDDWMARQEHLLKVIKHHEKVGDEHRTELARLRDQNQRQRESLKWALENRAGTNHIGGFRSGGCGCCSWDIEPPEHLREILMGVMKP